MKRFLQAYLTALGVWVLIVIVASLVTLLVLEGIPSSSHWTVWEVYPTGGPMEFSEVFFAWAVYAGFLLVPPAAVAGAWHWRRTRGDKAGRLTSA